MSSQDAIETEFTPVVFRGDKGTLQLSAKHLSFQSNIQTKRKVSWNWTAVKAHRPKVVVGKCIWDLTVAVRGTITEKLSFVLANQEDLQRLQKEASQRSGVDDAPAAARAPAGPPALVSASTNKKSATGPKKLSRIEELKLQMAAQKTSSQLEAEASAKKNKAELGTVGNSGVGDLRKQLGGMLPGKLRVPDEDSAGARPPPGAPAKKIDQNKKNWLESKLQLGPRPPPPPQQQSGNEPPATKIDASKKSALEAKLFFKPPRPPPSGEGAPKQLDASKKSALEAKLFFKPPRPPPSGEGAPKQLDASKKSALEGKLNFKPPRPPPSGPEGGPKQLDASKKSALEGQLQFRPPRPPSERRTGTPDTLPKEMSAATDTSQAVRPKPLFLAELSKKVPEDTQMASIQDEFVKAKRLSQTQIAQGNIPKIPSFRDEFVKAKQESQKRLSQRRLSQRSAMAAAAAAAGREIITVQVDKKPETKLGIKVSELQNTGKLVVTTVKEGGLMDGTALEPLMEIFSINGTQVAGRMSSTEVAGLLSSISGTLAIVAFKGGIEEWDKSGNLATAAAVGAAAVAVGATAAAVSQPQPNEVSYNQEAVDNNNQNQRAAVPAVVASQRIGANNYEDESDFEESEESEWKEDLESEEEEVLESGNAAALAHDSLEIYDDENAAAKHENAIVPYDKNAHALVAAGNKKSDPTLVTKPEEKDTTRLNVFIIGVIIIVIGVVVTILLLRRGNDDDPPSSNPIPAPSVPGYVAPTIAPQVPPTFLTRPPTPIPITPGVPVWVPGETESPSSGAPGTEAPGETESPNMGEPTIDAATESPTSADGSIVSPAPPQTGDPAIDTGTQSPTFSEAVATQSPTNGTVTTASPSSFLQTSQPTFATTLAPSRVPATSQPTQGTTEAPQSIQTSAPSAAGGLAITFPPYTDVALEDPSSPQTQALAWLSEDPSLPTYPEWKQEQRFALAAFFYSFNGNEWPELLRDSWMQYDDGRECDWASSSDINYYVTSSRQFSGSASFPDSSGTCNEEGRYIDLGVYDGTAISTTFHDTFVSSFIGTVPPEIAALTSLERMSIHTDVAILGVSMGELLPVQMQGLTNLTELDISNCYFRAWDFSVVSGMPAVNTLDLSYSDLDATMPTELGLLTTLQKLDASFSYRLASQQAIVARQANNGAPVIPSEIGLLSDLTVLSLSGNRLSGAFPPELTPLTSLEALLMSACNIQTFPPATLANLQRLDLSSNLIEGSIPADIGSFTALQYLDLDSNRLTGPLPAEIGLLTLLDNLNLVDNRLSGPLPAELSLITSLQVLDLARNKFSGPLSGSVLSLPELLELNVDSNAFTGTLSTLGTQLETLILRDNRLEGSLDGIEWPTSLITLDLPGNLLEGSLPFRELAQATSLSLLDGSDNGFAGTIDRGLGLLTNLDKLYLQYNDLSGSLPAELQLLERLEYMDLTQNRITGPIPSQIGLLKGRLSELVLDWNLVTDRIPTQVGLLSRLTTFSVRGYTLLGEIPKELGNMMTLEVLLLSGNPLTGWIPAALGQLTALATLSLELTTLSGTIPSQLGQMLSLKDLMLNATDLTGSVPLEVCDLPKLDRLWVDCGSVACSCDSCDCLYIS